MNYLEAVEDDLEETAPEFEPVFTNVYQYYGIKDSSRFVWIKADPSDELKDSPRFALIQMNSRIALGLP